MKMNELKQQITNIEKRQNELSQEIERLEQNKNQVKIQIADLVLNGEAQTEITKTEPEDNTKAFVKVEFSKGGKTYDYLWNEEKAPGEYVLVSTYRGDQERVRVIRFYRAVPKSNINYKIAKPIEE